MLPIRSDRCPPQKQRTRELFSAKSGNYSKPNCGICLKMIKGLA